MSRRSAWLVAALPIFLFFSSVAGAQQNQAALDAAREWVNLVDEGRYDQSWEQAAPLFQDSISRLDWVKSLDMVRAPLGKVVSRKLRNTANVTTLPGAPDGEYLIMEFDTSFQNKSSAVETLTSARQGNGKWEVAGYYIR